MPVRDGHALREQCSPPCVVQVSEDVLPAVQLALAALTDAGMNSRLVRTLRAVSRS